MSYDTKLGIFVCAALKDPYLLRVLDQAVHSLWNIHDVGVN